VASVTVRFSGGSSLIPATAMALGNEQLQPFHLFDRQTEKVAHHPSQFDSVKGAGWATSAHQGGWHLCGNAVIAHIYDPSQ
ncbi:MAG: hypothetical protein ORN49_10475, partial [Rhodobacteraceae bacterium]|nr:hypothetical protein [Paracoccaceae bacterium]